MEIIRGKNLEDALNKEYRQYLTGHLKRPQPYLTHIDDDIEVGISDYADFTADVPHVHNICTDHNYVLEGAMKVRLLDGSGREELVEKGDFYVIRPGIPHAVKNKEGTRVMFIKSPAINDKELVEIDEDTKRWLEDWEA